MGRNPVVIALGIVGSIFVFAITMYCLYSVWESVEKATLKITNSTQIADSGEQALQTMSDIPNPSDDLMILKVILGVLGIGGSGFVVYRKLTYSSRDG